MCSGSLELFLSSRESPGQREELSFQSLRGGREQPKKGRGKKTLRCLQKREKKKKKVSGKSDGKVKPIRGWPCTVHRGGGPGAPTGPWLCMGGAGRAGPLTSVPLTSAPPAQLKFTVLLEKGGEPPQTSGLRSVPRSFLLLQQQPTRGWLGGGWGVGWGRSQRLLCLTSRQRGRPFPSPTGVKSLLPLVFVQPYEWSEDC